MRGLTPVRRPEGSAPARIRRISNQGDCGATTEVLSFLPTSRELEHGIKTLFEKQTPSGIWPKYFPMFHYPDAGGNFCFTFEMLEAILLEFCQGDGEFLDSPGILDGLERAVDWCVRNRVRFQHGADVHFGWNSGGQISSLILGKPESWAMAVVHMFLFDLSRSLSRRIQARLLEKYRAEVNLKDNSSWDRLLDIKLCLEDGDEGDSEAAPARNTVKVVLKREILDKAMGQSFESLLTNSLKRQRTSALLFGPPGTSKTDWTSGHDEGKAVWLGGVIVAGFVGWGRSRAPVDARVYP